ncbi:hypothetical protein C0J52_25882 [Blattella germanica]|nr:hypothetical protein C0J52_25882 [Blattella germanica]
MTNLFTKHFKRSLSYLGFQPSSCLIVDFDADSLLSNSNEFAENITEGHAQLEPFGSASFLKQVYFRRKWLNRDLLSKVLSSELKTDISVLDYTVKNAVPKGSNYLSTLYRVLAHYTETNNGNCDKYYLVVKALPAGEFMQRFLQELKGFEKEQCMYTKVFPAIYEIMKTGTGTIHPLSAKSLFCPVERTLILDDMQHLGYRMANRHKGIDLDHCKVAVRALARFHAYSLKLYKQEPDIMDTFEESFYTKNEENVKGVDYMLTVHLNNLASEAEKWPGYEHYAEKVRKLIPHAFDVMVECIKPKKDGLNVLNHGDCWTNNMMFSYCSESGKVQDVRFVDFQVARFSSPVLDLHYFMCNCPNDEVRFDHRDNLLEEYHTEFVETLKILNLDPNILSLPQLKDEFAEKDIFGLITAATILATIVAEESAVPDMSGFTEEEVEKKTIPVVTRVMGVYSRKGFSLIMMPYCQNRIADEDLAIPTWLNSEFVSEVLSKEHSKDISLKDFSVSGAVPKGSNHLSTLYRIVTQDTSANKYQLIVKTLPAGEFWQKFLSDLKGFEKEECMYKRALPAIYKIMKSATGSIHPVSAKCLPCPVEKAIVLEDMKPLGYQMAANSDNGLDLEHCKVSVRALARFHAYSLELNRTDPEIMNNFEETWLIINDEKKEERQKHIEVNVSKLASQIETWPGFEHYAEKVMKFRHTASDIMAKAVERKEGSLNVLNHGDFWTNNLMFLYNKDNGKVEDVRFVDFQMGRFSSPALDLQYFMCHCPSNDVRLNHRDTLLEEYHAEFVDTLKILKLDPNMLSLQQLKDEFAEKDIFGLMTAMFVLMITAAQRTGSPNFKKSKKAPVAGAYAGEVYREIMQQLLPFYEERGGLL